MTTRAGKLRTVKRTQQLRSPRYYCSLFPSWRVQHRHIRCYIHTENTHFPCLCASLSPLSLLPTTVLALCNIYHV